MANTDPRVDVYIAHTAEFAKPILEHLRALIHKAAPEIQETLKWGFPHFTHQGIVCSMAAFKGHCTFGFWKSALLIGVSRGGSLKENKAMGQFGRITALAELPDDKTVLRLVRKAVQLNSAGVKVPAKPRPKQRAALVVPDYFEAALQKNPKAKATFDGFTYSHKKEYLEWIAEAKREETRATRLRTALDWMANGKPRHWKYANCG